MNLRLVGVRLLRIFGVSLLTVLALGFVFLQVQQHIIRARSERLLADFQSIRLNQTTWPAAQALMQRWGKLGHAHGTCNATDCAYDITVLAWPSIMPPQEGVMARWFYRLGFVPTLAQRISVRFSVMELRFVVEDGVVRRTRLHVTAETMDDKGYMSLLLVTAAGHASLNGSVGGLSSVGADEELGLHPAYVVGPDGFCTGCENIELDYTPQIAPDTLVWLTSFDLSCITRWRPCRRLSDFAPALMREDAAHLRDVSRNSVLCNTPAWALARDAEVIWLADALSSEKVIDPNPPYGQEPSLVEQDEIRLVSVLKGPMDTRLGMVLRFRPYDGLEYEARAVPEHLAQSHRYILLPSTEDAGGPRNGAEAWRCGVLDDTPENEAAVERGIAMGDHLRVPELTGAWPW